MSWSFNPFTGNLDLVGGGAVVFEGEVETFADLPETIGDPAVGASYLVRTSTGVWLVNRRQAGIWIRKNNTGVRATDWEYGGDYPVNSVAGKTGNVTLTNSDISGLGSAATANLNAISDADLRIVGSTDATKKVAIEVDTNVPANTTVTLTAPSASGTLALAGAAPATHAAAHASAGSDPLAPSDIGLGATDDVTFKSLEVSNPNGSGTITLTDGANSATGQLVVYDDGGDVAFDFAVAGNAMFTVSESIATLSVPLAFEATADVVLIRDEANTLALRRTTNSQSLRLYNTFTSATNFERLNLRWASNELILDAEAGSAGGTLRGIKIGSATSSLLGFYGATPVAQRAAIADATDAATTQARLNDLLAAMRSLGLIAT